MGGQTVRQSTGGKSAGEGYTLGNPVNLTQERLTIFRGKGDVHQESFSRPG